MTHTTSINQKLNEFLLNVQLPAGEDISTLTQDIKEEAAILLIEKAVGLIQHDNELVQELDEITKEGLDLEQVELFLKKHIPQYDILVEEVIEDIESYLNFEQ